MSRIILETQRLFLREFESSDAVHFLELNSDPEVIKYTGDPAFENEEAALRFILNYHPYKEHGYGRWACILKESKDFIGFCGLRKDDTGPDTDIGFRFHKQHWGKGYATESAIACMNHGFSKHQLERIIGHAVHENTASIRVLEKIGMHYLHDADCHGSLAALYVKNNPSLL